MICFEVNIMENSEEKQLLSDYYKLTEQQKELLTAMIKLMIKQNTKK